MITRSSTTLATGSQLIAVVARWVLGCAMIYFGLVKAIAPVDFLKVLREYELTQQQGLLNFIAGALPWMEVMLGALLLCGIAVRGAAFTTGLMLAVFTLVVMVRAYAIYQAGDIPFCGIKFDCGCGNGPVQICGKLLENSTLVLLSMLACRGSTVRFCLRHDLINPCPPDPNQCGAAAPFRQTGIT